MGRSRPKVETSWPGSKLVMGQLGLKFKMGLPVLMVETGHLGPKVRTSCLILKVEMGRSRLRSTFLG